MGGCNSSAQDDQARAVSRAIDKALKTDKTQLAHSYKLLLLGSGESGKSTFFKQMKILSSTLSDKDKEHVKKVIQRNCLSQMQAILRALPLAEFELEPGTKGSADLILATNEDGDDILSPQVAQAIKICWADKACNLTYQRRGVKYQLNDAAEYFFVNIDRFVEASYEPTEQDVLRARIRTTGIEEAEFNINDFHFKLIDVGGQRSERRKWLHCFDSVTAILYFVAMNEYDMLLREDETSNRMVDSIALFEGVCNSPWFKDVTFILLLNKTDLFRQKIDHIDLKVCFPEYTGGCNFEAASEYIKQKFLQVNKSPHDVFVHFIVAVDTDNVKLVFDATRQALISMAVTANFGLTLTEATGGQYV